MSFEAWDRYALGPMFELWSARSKLEHWHEVELAWLKTRVNFGKAPQEAYERAREVRITREVVKRIKKLDKGRKGFDHETEAFKVAVQEHMGEWASEYHRDITSYDIIDPALILILRKAARLILNEAYELEEVLRKKALEHKWTLMIARTHGQYAEPTTFGHLLMVYAEEIARCRRRIQNLFGTLSSDLTEGRISGPVGMYGDIDPAMEKQALGHLGLRPAKAETQILQRDRHAAIMLNLAVLVGGIAQMARTFWEMMRSDCGELREPRKKTQRGSSSMAWKRNPILNEQLQGVADLIGGWTGVCLAQIATPEFRDISQSITERFNFPLITTLTHYGAVRMARCVENLEVFPARMMRNLDATRGVWAGQRVQAALMDAGVPYDIAYEYIQRAGFFASDREIPMFYVLCGDVGGITLSDEDSRTAKRILGIDNLASFFRARDYVKRGVEHIFNQV